MIMLPIWIVQQGLKLLVYLAFALAIFVMITFFYSE